MKWDKPPWHYVNHSNFVRWTDIRRFHLRTHLPLTDLFLLHIHMYERGGGVQNTYEHSKLRAYKFSYLNKLHKSFIVCVRYFVLKSHTKSLDHILKDTILYGDEMSHSSPLRVSYVVYIVSSKCGLYSTFATALLFSIRCVPDISRSLFSQ